jgi:hypothetical protein
MNARIEATQKVLDIYANTHLDAELKRIESLYTETMQSVMGYVDQVIMPQIDDEFFGNVYAHNQLFLQMRLPLNADSLVILNIENCFEKKLDCQEWSLQIRDNDSPKEKYSLVFDARIRSYNKYAESEHTIICDYANITAESLGEFLSKLAEIQTEDDLLEYLDEFEEVLNPDNLDETCGQFLSSCDE